MAQDNTATADAQHTDNADERDAVRSLASEQGLQALVFYGHDPWIAFVDRDTPPATSHALPNERIAIVDWYDDGEWGVSIVTASDRQTNPEWEMPAEPDERFETRAAAVESAAGRL